jgi:cobyrinic acid a,c-diamide synthase
MISHLKVITQVSEERRLLLAKRKSLKSAVWELKDKETSKILKDAVVSDLVFNFWTKRNLTARESSGKLVHFSIINSTTSRDTITSWPLPANSLHRSS